MLRVMLSIAHASRFTLIALHVNGVVAMRMPDALRVKLHVIAI